MKGFNLAKFKKAQEDQHSATLIHEKGHKIVLAKKGLSALQRKQLEALPVQHFDDGGEAIPYDQLIPQEAQSNAPFGVPADALKANQDVANQQQVQVNIPGVTPERAPATGDAPQAETTQPTDQAAQPQATEALPPKLSTFDQQIQAQNNYANQLVDLGKKESSAVQKQIDNIAKLPSQETLISNYKKQDEDFATQYKQSNMDPKAYWNNHSKIAAGIGVALGALGQVFGQGNIHENPALKAINTGIDRELESQKNNQSKVMNLWEMNRHALKNDLEANLLTKSQYTNLAKLEVEKYGAQATGMKEKLAAQNTSLQLQAQINMYHMQMAAMKPSANFQSPADQLGYQKRLGLNSDSEQKEIATAIDNADTTKKASSGILDAFFQAAKDARPATGGLGTSPKTLLTPFGAKTPGQQAFIFRTVPTAKDVTGSVKQAEIDNLEHNVVPGLGDSDKTVYGTKLNSIIDYLTGKSDSAIASSKGIHLKAYPQTNIDRNELVKYVYDKYPEARQYLNSGAAPTQRNVAGARPPQVVQNGFVYNLNPKTGQYE